MFREILKIIPKLEASDLQKMDTQLSKRFGRIAKKFGSGLKTSLLGGGIAGLAIGLIDKILNPLKEVQEAIDRTLNQGDDLVTNAKQFGTTAGKLFKLTKLGESTGLDADNLYMLIAKFQTAVAEAKADPEKQTSVRAFADMPDTAEAFFQFIQALRKMSSDQKVLVQQEVFGEKQILKMSDFLETDMRDQLLAIGARPSEEYTPGITKLGGLNDYAGILKARDELEDTMQKAAIINKGMVDTRANLDRLEAARLNQQTGNYQALATISEASTRMIMFLEKGYGLLTQLLDQLKPITEFVKKYMSTRSARGVNGKGE